MILPASYTAVLILLITSLICLGLWINTFKATGPKWRFELYAMDFGAGALVTVLLAAYTVGTLGSDLGFSDRLLVAGRTAQVLALVSGGVFNLGNMLLLASVSLLGICAAFPMSIGIALIVNACFQFRQSNVIYLVIGAVLVLFSIFFELRAARLRQAALTSKKASPPPSGGASQSARSPSVPSGGTAATASVAARPASATMRAPGNGQRTLGGPKSPRTSKRAVRGIIAAVISGIALGMFVPILQNCMPGDFGLGPYAAMLLFGLGVVISTVVYNFYFLNITVEGAPLTFSAYFDGNVRQHVLGILGGGLCAVGLLAASAAVTSSTAAGVSPRLQILLPLLSAVLAWVVAATKWKELSVPPAARSALLAGFLCFAVSIGVFAFGFTLR